MSDLDDDGRRRRWADQPEIREMRNELRRLADRVTVLETRSEERSSRLREDIAELRQDVAACATKEQLRPAVWLLATIGTSGIAAFVLALWNLLLRRGGAP